MRPRERIFQAQKKNSCTVGWSTKAYRVLSVRELVAVRPRSLTDAPLTARAYQQSPELSPDMQAMTLQGAGLGREASQKEDEDSKKKMLLATPTTS